MSRIGKMQVVFSEDVKVRYEENVLEVKGPKGALSKTIDPRMALDIDAKSIVVVRTSENRIAKSLHGLTRSLINNMVVGVTKGFERILEINGVGYRAELQDNNLLKINVGYSHPVLFPIPSGVHITVERNTRITVSGIDKELVQLVASKIRAIKPPESYKGKGVKYADEYIKRKVGKAGTK
ncbi:MAG: 50S ribosomal protein L6 [Thermodesulfobacteriota bacterium]|nr:50S ribosomal protein L6 [Thermodesulfobacteriota bacterium]